MEYKEQNVFKYLVANDKDHLWGITVTSVGYQHVSPEEAYPPAGHPAAYSFNVASGRVLHEYQLIYVVDGRGSFQTEKNNWDVGAGTLFMIFPGRWHTYQPQQGTGWSVYWIGFRGKVIDERVAAGFFLPDHPVYRVGISALLIDVFRNAMQAAQSEQPLYQQLMCGAVSLLMGIALHRSGNPRSADEQTRSKIAQAKLLFREHFTDNCSAQTVARKLHVSYSWLRTAFKRQTGMAPAQYVLEIKLLQAMELLSDPVMTVKEIAYRLNFNSSRYFSSFFRKRIGCSPQQYRLQLHDDGTKPR